MSETIQPGTDRVGLTLVVYTAWNAVTGVVYPRGGARLSDMFNYWEDTFIPIEAAHFVDPASGQAEAQAQGTVLLPREEILLLHEVPSTAVPSQSSGAEEMRIQKHAMPVQARLGPYRVDGILYLPQFANLVNYLNRAEGAFLPLTDATIVSTVGEHPRQVHAPFVLVSRGHLVVREAWVGGTAG